MADKLIDRLTAREIEALRLVSVHMNSKQIARQLGLSPATVDRHIANALHKLGVPTRLSAVRLLMESSVPGPTDLAAENPSTQSSPMASGSGGRQLPSRPSKPAAFGGGESSWSAGHSLASVVIKFLIDAVLITLFFAVLTAGAATAHWIVTRCEAANVDHIVVLMLKAVHYLLVAIDGFGVVAATVMLVFRFLKALKDAK